MWKAVSNTATCVAWRTGQGTGGPQQNNELKQLGVEEKGQEGAKSQWVIRAWGGKRHMRKEKG